MAEVYEYTDSLGRVYEIEAENQADAQRIGDDIQARVDGGDTELSGMGGLDAAGRVAEIGEDGGVINYGRITADVGEPQAPQDQGWLARNPNEEFNYGSTRDEAARLIDPEGGFRSLGGGYARPESNLGLTAFTGMAQGLGDEIMGGVGAVSNAVKAPFSDSIDFDPIGAYQTARDYTRATADATYAANPWLAPAVEIASGLAGGGALARAIPGSGVMNRSLGGLARQGAKEGAILGGLSGFGYGEGLGGSSAGALLGGGLGAGIGAAIPGVARWTRENVINPISDWAGAGADRGRQLVSRYLNEGGTTPREAARTMFNARGDGVPLGLMDMNDQTRGLAASLARRPGPHREMLRQPVLERQAGQNERVRGAIERDLGPIGNVDDIGDSIMQRAKRVAGPLYEKAYAAPGVASEEIDSILATPAGKDALRRAVEIARNERVDPTRLGIDFDAAGDPVFIRVPTMRTLDYVKRGLDDVVESRRDIRGKLDTGGRAINDVRASLVREADRLNPDYAAARAAFAGPAQGREALELGAGSINDTAGNIARATRGMSPYQKEMFALGHRSRLVDAMEGRVDGANRSSFLLGTPKKRDALQEIYGQNSNLGRFVNTMEAEDAANQTYRAMTGNSATAERTLFDAETGDPANAVGTVINGVRAATTGSPGAIANFFQGLNLGRSFGPGGKGAQAARNEAAALLSETDPIVFRLAMREVRRREAERAVAQAERDRRALGVGMFFGRGAGALSGVTTRGDQ